MRAYRQLHEAPACRTMMSHLCCLMNVDFTLFAVVLHHVNPSLLGSFLPSCLMHISVECQFRISGMIHSLHMTIRRRSKSHTATAIRRCCIRFATSWSRPTLSHTSLFLILSLQVIPSNLLKQDISNTRNLFSCVCFKVQVSKLYINTLSTILSHIPSTSWRYLCL